ncbi:ABC transporter ATP-binding protein [Methanococcoides burtonii]|uniref:Cobalamin import ATP-binding protein BtuD n=1 Tax=Methanococcoides burtonii (strain DSM 6242 / NBRC 107633 / OCM 468 / ACE-M) TaxID=259564 RepID=Q12X01_METBU|nr:ABC transporter ATP-binding protein [Methanococcoides burtonii]ABE52025.1 Iron complex/Vitamin B12 ABC transporter ATPase subunit [Methanococcoides burtonii DSM 6242]
MVKIKIKDMCFGYASTPILENVSVDIYGSSFVSIVGPNGAGKSTMLKCINKILVPDSGDIHIDGYNLKNMKRIEVAKNIAYVPQSSNRVFPTTVFETVLMGRRPHIGWFSNEKDIEKVWQVLEEMGIEDLALCSFDELSGGQQQKILIARALAQDTGAILLDEPTSNLDIWHQLDVMENVQRLVKEKKVAAIMAVHDLNLASRYSDQILMMKDGKVVSAGTPAQVLTTENIAKVYEVEAHVHNYGETPYVMPLKQLGMREIT